MLFVTSGAREFFCGHTRDGKTRLTDLVGITDDAPLTVQADGDELNNILYQLKGIPTSERRVQVWRGDAAQFIVDNLIL